MSQLSTHLIHTRFVNLIAKIFLPISMRRAHEALGFCLKLANIAHNLCRNTGNDFSDGNIFCHDRTCTHNSIISDRYARQNNRTISNKNVIAYGNTTDSRIAS